MNENTPDTEFNHLVRYTLHLADTNLILSQRNAEWCGHGPVLEQDIAITNISLDLLGQARNFYQYAAKLINENAGNYPSELNNDFLKIANKATEDLLAYHRNERAFKSLLITELPRGDWAQTILRQFFYSAYQYLLYGQLQNNTDRQIAGIAEKAFKEVSYHLKWSSEWVVRLGDGTDQSHQRMLQALEIVWAYTGEFFIAADFEEDALIGFDLKSLKESWLLRVKEVFTEATLLQAFENSAPEKTFMHTGGKTGIHTEHMGYILAELQYLQRAYPGAEW